MEKFEYKSEEINGMLSGYYGKFDAPEFTALLNQRAKEGWNLITVTHIARTPRLICVFKRELS